MGKPVRVQIPPLAFDDQNRRQELGTERSQRRRFEVSRWLSTVGFAFIVLAMSLPTSAAEENLPGGPLQIGVFQVDATPPLGTPVAYALARKIEDPLTARGIVLLGAGKPIVLCAVDWIGIANGGHDVWRESLARAVGTSVDRVSVHVLHQHDGVRCDFSSEELLAPQGLAGKRFDVPFVRKTIANAAAAARAALDKAQPVTHLGVGQARVEKVASNRRILGPDGRVAIARSSSYRIPEPILSRLSAEAKRQGYELSAARVEEALAAPEGVIDPLLKMLTFFNEERPLVSLSYYATHPQSYFGKGDVTSEFVGLARAEHERAHGGLPLVHFNGASGNVAAGKYNDGTPETRVVLTRRMADGMQRAWEATRKVPLTAAECEWRVHPVRLPVAAHLDADKLTRHSGGSAGRRERSHQRGRQAGLCVPHAARRSHRADLSETRQRLRSAHAGGVVRRISIGSASRCGRTTPSAWPPTATAAPVTSAPKSPTRKAAMRRNRRHRTQPRTSNAY